MGGMCYIIGVAKVGLPVHGALETCDFRFYMVDIMYSFNVITRVGVNDV